MKTSLIAVGAILFGLGGIAAADEPGHVHGAPSASGSAAAPAADPHAKHMQEMRDQLAKIKAATDPQEKERLVGEFVHGVEEHLKAAEGKMHDMHDMHERRHGPMGMGMMGKGGGEGLEKRVDGLEKRLDLLQTLVERMSRHGE